MDARVIRARNAVFAVAAVMIAGCGGMGMGGDMRAGGESMLRLSGAEEVPAVSTPASGSGRIVVGPDGSVSGSITTAGVAGVAAHIHEGAAGSNGPVIIPLVKSGDNVWSVPAGAKLNSAQLASYRAGRLYVNVHSAANKGGEVRAQIAPDTRMAGPMPSSSTGTSGY